MRVALTGTPGVGKTTLAGHASRHGWRVVDVKAWAAQERCVVAYDEDDQADVIDVVELASLVPEDDGSNILYEGHISHFLDLDEIWVLRLDPVLLRPRLVARGYSSRKVHENLEAEALDLILQEALDTGTPVRQRDAGQRSPAELFASFLDADAPAMEDVDWSDRLPLEAA